MVMFLKFAMFAFMALLVLALPLSIIWSLNTLFSLDIEYTVQTWLAAFFLGTIVGHRGYKV